MKNYYDDIQITATRPCCQCEGEGNHLKQLLNEHHDSMIAWAKRNTDRSDYRAWSKRREEHSAFIWLSWGYDEDLPHEDSECVKCHSCNGTGQESLSLNIAFLVDVIKRELAEEREQALKQKLLNEVEQRQKLVPIRSTRPVIN